MKLIIENEGITKHYDKADKSTLTYCKLVDITLRLYPILKRKLADSNDILIFQSPSDQRSVVDSLTPKRWYVSDDSIKELIKSSKTKLQVQVISRSVYKSVLSQCMSILIFGSIFLFTSKSKTSLIIWLFIGSICATTRHVSILDNTKCYIFEYTCLLGIIISLFLVYNVSLIVSTVCDVIWWVGICILALHFWVSRCYKGRTNGEDTLTRFSKSYWEDSIENSISKLEDKFTILKNTLDEGQKSNKRKLLLIDGCVSKLKEENKHKHIVSLSLEEKQVQSLSRDVLNLTNMINGLRYDITAANTRYGILEDAFDVRNGMMSNLDESLVSIKTCMNKQRVMIDQNIDFQSNLSMKIENFKNGSERSRCEILSNIEALRERMHDMSKGFKDTDQEHCNVLNVLESSCSKLLTDLKVHEEQIESINKDLSELSSIFIKTNVLEKKFQDVDKRICAMEVQLKYMNTDITSCVLHSADKYNSIEFIGSIGTRGIGRGQVEYPYDIAVDSESMIVYISDKGSSRITAFNDRNQVLYSFGENGTRSGQFKVPSGLCISNPMLYVVDNGNCRIQVFNMETGEYLYSWGSRGSKDGYFIDPKSIYAYDKQVYVCDSGNNRIQVFNRLGGFIRKWGGTGSPQGYFHCPEYVTVHRDLVYICDRDNDRVQVFDLVGKPIACWNEIYKPRGIAAYKNIVFISESNSSISVYATTGIKVASIGKHGTLLGHFKTPSGIAVHTPSRTILVVDRFNHRIQYAHLPNS